MTNTYAEHEFICRAYILLKIILSESNRITHLYIYIPTYSLTFLYVFACTLKFIHQGYWTSNFFRYCCTRGFDHAIHDVDHIYIDGIYRYIYTLYIYIYASMQQRTMHSTSRQELRAMNSVRYLDVPLCIIRIKYTRTVHLWCNHKEVFGGLLVVRATCTPHGNEPVGTVITDVPRENSLDRRHEYQTLSTAASRVNRKLD
jgi:hypothetical protein